MKITYDHFNGSIPQELREKLGELAKIVMHDFIGDIGRGECFACSNIDEIYGYDPGGFIPFQHGGYKVTELYRHDIDSSYHLTQGQNDAAIEQEKNMYSSFFWDNREELEALGLEADTFSYDDIPESLQNAFSDYESEWFEPALVSFGAYVTKPGKDIWGGEKQNESRAIELYLAVNYNDAPYYREKYDETIHTLSLSLDEFMTLEPEAIAKGFFEQAKEKLK